LIFDSKIYALPYYVDTLALYYNTQQFQSSGTTSSRPAASWTNFKNQVTAMTNKNGAVISRSGAGIGTAKNVKNAVDIFYTMLLQNNGKICRNEACDAVMLSDNKEAINALNEYVSYSDPASPNYVWDSNYLKGLEYNNIFADIDAFIRGRVSSYFGYARDYEQIVTLGKNTNLKFEIAEIPQTDDAAANNEKVAFANYWAPAVSKASAQPQLAWDFVKFMTSKSTLAKYYETNPMPPSREDLIDTDSSNPLRVFHRQAKVASSLVLFDQAQFHVVFSDIIEGVATKATSSFNSLRKAESDLNLLLQPYFEVLGDKATENSVAQ
jgi:multiple sugar transport system substrate-binding protein